MKTILYLIVFPNGKEEKIWVEHWKEFQETMNILVQRYGLLPDLIYRKE